MTRKGQSESVEVMVARIDERVEQIHRILPTVARHDRDILVGKILGCVALAVLAVKYPVVAEAFAKAFQ